jgi:hypothetical protein
VRALNLNGAGMGSIVRGEALSGPSGAPLQPSEI